jgi:hypothetical protein
VNFFVYLWVNMVLSLKAPRLDGLYELSSLGSCFKQDLAILSDVIIKKLAPKNS